ncbi:hypothetical protein ACFL0O_11220 [Thermodesulfobacteriota bacterium]
MADESVKNIIAKFVTVVKLKIEWKRTILGKVQVGGNGDIPGLQLSVQDFTARVSVNH